MDSASNEFFDQMKKLSVEDLKGFCTALKQNPSAHAYCPMAESLVALREAMDGRVTPEELALRRVRR